MRLILFDQLVANAVFGEAELIFDAARLDQWCALFPEDGRLRPLMPPGMTAVVIMHAYMALLTPRPPGNVHGAQVTTLHRLPRLGERLRTRLSCCGKELKTGRRWIDLATDTADDDGVTLFTGRMRLLWAA